MTFPPIRWPKHTPAIDAWRAKYDALGPPRLPDALATPATHPRDHTEPPGPQVNCWTRPGGCEICDR